MQTEYVQLFNELNEWRKTKPRKHTPIPKEFWDKIKILYKKYPNPKLKSYLGINGVSWKKKVLEKKVSNNNIKPENFIQLKPQKIKSEFLQIKLPGGAEVVIFQ